MSNYESDEQKAARQRRDQWQDQRAAQQEAEANEARYVYQARVHAMACAVAEGIYAAGGGGSAPHLIGETAVAIVDEIDARLRRLGR